MGSYMDVEFSVAEKSDDGWLQYRDLKARAAGSYQPIGLSADAPREATNITAEGDAT